MTRVFGTILISNYTRVLLVLGRSSGKWSFPKGHAQDCEEPLECARRETYEETGLMIYPNQKNIIHLSKGTYFLHRTSSDIKVYPIDRREISKAQWISLQDIPKYSCNVDVNNFYRTYKDKFPVRPRINPLENILSH